MLWIIMTWSAVLWSYLLISLKVNIFQNIKYKINYNLLILLQFVVPIFACSNYFEVFRESQDSWKAVVIDEFQDTSAMQYKFLKILASHHKITIIGDDDQVLIFLLYP